MLFCDR